MTEVPPTPKSTTLARNLRWGLSERVLQIITNGLANALMIRSLGPAVFGRLAIALALFALLQPLTLLGTTHTVLRIADSRSSGAVRAGVAASALGSTAATLGMVACALSGLSLFEGSRAYILVMAGAMALRPLASFDSWFIAQERMAVTSRLRTAVNLLANVLRLAGVWEHAGPSFFVGTFAGEYATAALVVTIAYGLDRQRTSRAAQSAPSGLRHLLRAAFPLLLASMSAIVYMRADQLMLGGFSGSRQVGLYAAAASLAELTFFVPVVFTNAVMSGYLRRTAGNKVDVPDELKTILALLSLAGTATALVGIFSGPLVARYLYGDAFSAMTPVLQLLFCSTPFVFVGVGQVLWTVQRSHERLGVYRTVLAAVVNVTANVFVLPRYGAVGAAVTTVAAHIISSVAANLIWRASRAVGLEQLRALSPVHSAAYLWASRQRLARLVSAMEEL